MSPSHCHPAFHLAVQHPRVLLIVLLFAKRGELVSYGEELQSSLAALISSGLNFPFLEGETGVVIYCSQGQVSKSQREKEEGLKQVSQ